MDSRSVRVRFAPSPTGFLHIGGARTALFNWIFARQNKGAFLLRVEDTDSERNNPEFLQSILEGLTWLGLTWDEDVVYQSQRKERHQTVARTLYEQGGAYYCVCPPGQQQGESAQLACACRDKTLTEGALRVRRPLEGSTEFSDEVYGNICVQQEELDDMVILRANGDPTYTLCSVVDDYDMNITHVIRGVDHLTNTARQLQITRLLSWPQPVFAHLPLIHGQDGKKLSKRHGAVNVFEYKDAGFLPEAMQNAFIRMGWGLADHEFMNGADMLKLFSLSSVGKSKAQFAKDKLDHYNRAHMTALPGDDILHRVEEYMPTSLTSEDRAVAQALLPEIIKRSVTLIDVAEALTVLSPPQSYDVDVTEEMRARVCAVLEACVSWTAQNLEETFRTYAKENSCKLVQLAQPLRVLLTGKTVSPPVFLLMEALGKDAVWERVRLCAK